MRVCVFVTALFWAANLSAGEKIVTIIHTNDLHSHLLGFSPNIDYRPDRIGGDDTRGGWARIASVIQQEKEKRKNAVLVLDAGDFLMGSLFHMVAREEAVELRLMKDMGYDALTLGNHEFDLKPAGLARILQAAAARGGMPAILFSNAVFSKESDRDDSLEEVFKKGLIRPYAVLEREGIKIGIFGLLGKDAAEKAPFASPVKFRDPVETAREMVKILRQQEKVDMVIFLSHSGVGKKTARSEDEILAKEVQGIDVIVGGHSHDRMEKPIKINSTLILQAGEYGKDVGVLDLVWDKGKVQQKNYRLITVDAAILGDKTLQEKIASYIAVIDREVLQSLNLSFGKIIGQTAFDLRISEEESNLGNLIADSIRWYVNKHDYDPLDPVTKVAAAIESNGLIRDALLRGKTGALAVSDVFGSVPLGIGVDDTMGYPLVSCYLYASEIKKALEILTSVYPRQGDSYFLQVSGLKFTYNPRRVIFDRVTHIWLGSEEEGYVPLDYSPSNKNLYRIAVNIYNAAFLKIVGKYTYQILNIVPKDRKGAPVADLAASRVDADKNQPGIQELKEWIGLMEYIQSFPDTDGDGLPNIPEKYGGKLGRIVMESSWNPVSLLSRGTWATWTAFSAFTVLLILLAFMAILIRKFLKRSFARP